MMVGTCTLLMRQLLLARLAGVCSFKIHMEKDAELQLLSWHTKSCVHGTHIAW